MIEIVGRHRISPDMDFVQLTEGEWTGQGFIDKYWLALECRNGIEWYLPFESALEDFMIQSDEVITPIEEYTQMVHESVPTATNLQVEAVWWYAVRTKDHEKALEFYIEKAKFYNLYRFKPVGEIPEDEWTDGSGESCLYPENPDLEQERRDSAQQDADHAIGYQARTQ